MSGWGVSGMTGLLCDQDNVVGNMAGQDQLPAWNASGCAQTFKPFELSQQLEEMLLWIEDVCLYGFHVEQVQREQQGDSSWHVVHCEVACCSTIAPIPLLSARGLREKQQQQLLALRTAVR